MRFAPLQRFPAHSSSIMVGLASPGRLRPQVFSTSRRFLIRREPAGLVSCRIRSWGCALQSFAPTAWPYAVSGADPLVVLVPARHHLYVPLPLAHAKAETSVSPVGSSPSRPSRSPDGPNRCRPSRRYHGTAEPNGRPTLGGRNPLEPDSGSTLRGRNPFEPNGRASPPVPKHRRTGRPIDPPGPKPRRTRRPALCAPIRRPTRHRTSIRSPRARRLASTGPLARLSETRRLRPVRAIPPAPRRGRSPAGNTEAADRHARNRSSVRARRAARSSTTRRLPNLVRPRLPRTDPKAEPFPACAPTCLTSNRRSGETSRRSPLGDRGPFDSSPGPKSLRIELLRSVFREPKLRSNRTSGRDGPESFLTFRGLIPAAIRHSRVGCLGRRVARSSPGLFALQGVPPLCGRLGLRRAFPSWASHHRARTTGDAALQGVARSEVGSSLSRPPTLMGLVAS
jgi:hypothetical protein